MSRPLDTHGNGDHDLTRRDILHTGVTLGTAAMTAAITPSSAVAAQGKYGGHGVVLNYAYPEVWDPHIAGTLGALGSISPLYNQVVEFNPIKPDEVVGDLAKSWEVTDDGLTYTFQLHEQIKWWDGHDLTADDVAFSIKRMIAPGEPRPRVGLLRPFIESVEVLDRHRVQIRLKYPSPSFLQFLAVDYMKIVPKHVIEAGVDINRWENIVGSGPFKTKRARRGDSVMHEKNPTYFKPGRPYLDTLTVRPINDQGTIAAALRTEKVHMTSASFNLSVEDVLKLEPELQGKYTVHWQPGVNNGIHFFVNVEKEPWTDLRLIKALRLATDQQEIQNAFGEGKFYQGAPFPVASWYGSPPDELTSRPGYQSPKAPDIEAAKALLKEAGYDPPSKLGKRVIVTTPPWIVPDLAQLWAAQMRRNLGLDIEIKMVDTPSGVTAYVAGDYDIGIWGYGVNISDPDDWVNAIYGPGARNYTRWKNPDFLKLFDQQSRELDRTKRRKSSCARWRNFCSPWKTRTSR